MSGLWLSPAAPETVAPAYLEQVRDLHGVVRDWIEASATAQKNAHLLANLPYVDLMFAFGFATLGDHPTANKLVEDARKVMEGPIPTGGNAQADEEVGAVVIRNFLFKVLEYRIGEARAGQLHQGPLSIAVHALRDEIVTRSGSGPVNNPYKMAVYATDRFRERFSMAEPDEPPDPYGGWSMNPFRSELDHALAGLQATRDASRIVARVRQCWRDGIPGSKPEVIRLSVLSVALPLAGRVGVDFALELVSLLREMLPTMPSGSGASPDLPKRQGELLVAGLRIAVRFGRPDIADGLIAELTTLLRRSTDEVRFKLIGLLGMDCVQCLHHFGRRGDIASLVEVWLSEFFPQAEIADLRTQYARKPEQWASILRARLVVASGWLASGQVERASPVLSAARRELLGSDAMRLQPKDYTELAQSYVDALGAASGGALEAVNTLFREMPLTRITNTWRTAVYYSRFHLELVEDTVFAVCRLGLDNPTPAIVQA